MNDNNNNYSESFSDSESTESTTSGKEESEKETVSETREVETESSQPTEFVVTFDEDEWTELMLKLDDIRLSHDNSDIVDKVGDVENKLNNIFDKVDVISNNLSSASSETVISDDVTQLLQNTQKTLTGIYSILVFFLFVFVVVSLYRFFKIFF